MDLIKKTKEFAKITVGLQNVDHSIDSKKSYINDFFKFYKDSSIA